MIEVASPATPQLGSLLPLVIRPRRWRSPKSAPGAHHHHLRREKSDPFADRKHPVATLHSSKSALMLVPTPHQNTPATLKSP
jgi:hypothetical protein